MILEVQHQRSEKQEESICSQILSKDKSKNKKLIAQNRHARHDYEILERYEAGIELVGCEVKSLQESNAQISDAFCMIRGGECWLNNMHISPYSHGNLNNPEPNRKRKLLLHKAEIKNMNEKIAEKGLALVPLSLYYSYRGKVKVEIAIARGKKLHDKREDLKKKTIAREVERALKFRSR